MSLFGPFATVRAQAPHHPGFAAAFAYVDAILRPGSDSARRLGALAAGESHKVELGDGVFAIEQVYLTKPRAEGAFESHRRLIDLQVIVAGREMMEVADLSRLTVRQPYDADRDVAFYELPAATSVLHCAAGDAAIFYPADGHMPTLRTGPEPELVRKTVVKIPVG